MTSITIELPDDLAARATSEGVLRQPAVVLLIDAATRAAAMARLRGMWSGMDKAGSDVPLSDEEISMQIKAARAAFRTGAAAA